MKTPSCKLLLLLLLVSCSKNGVEVNNKRIKVNLEFGFNLIRDYSKSVDLNIVKDLNGLENIESEQIAKLLVDGKSVYYLKEDLTTLK